MPLRGLGLLLVMVLWGCEAPLVVEHVQNERSKAVRRSDSFQAIARNDNTIVAVGGMGTIVVSDNAGQSWQRVILTGKPDIVGVDACPDQTFVALGYDRNLWLGDAQGSNWKARPLDSDETPQALVCDQEGRVWVGADFSTLMRSDDRGGSWRRLTMDEDIHITVVAFPDNKTGFALGEFGTVLHSSDGGESWDFMNPLPDEFYVQDAYFKNSEDGWVVGLSWTVYRTADAGQSWQKEETGTETPLYGVTAFDNGLVAVGENGLVIRRNDGVWTRIHHDQPIRSYLRGVENVDGKLIMVAGDRGTLTTIAIH